MEDDGDVLLDLGPQPGGAAVWPGVVGFWAGAAAALVAGLRLPFSWFGLVPALCVAAVAARHTWDAGVAPTHATIRRDGEIVLPGRLATRRFPARAVISVEREDEPGSYVLEWGLDHHRIRVQDGSRHLLRTLDQLNPDVAMLDTRRKR